MANEIKFVHALNKIQGRFDPLHREKSVDLVKKLCAALIDYDVDSTIDPIIQLYPGNDAQAVGIRAMNAAGEFPFRRHSIDETYHLLSVFRFNLAQTLMSSNAFRDFKSAMDRVGVNEESIQRRTFIALTIDPDVALCRHAIGSAMLKNSMNYVTAIRDFSKKTPRNELVNAAVSALKTVYDCDTVIGFDATAITRKQLVERLSEITSKAIQCDIIERASYPPTDKLKEMEIHGLIESLSLKVGEFEAKDPRENLARILARYNELLAKKQALMKNLNWGSDDGISSGCIKALPDPSQIGSYEEARAAIKIATTQIELIRKNQKSQ